LAPALDAIMPTRDRHALVPEAARSVLSQTHRELTLWIVDAGSDPPLRLPKDLRADQRVRLLRSDEPVSPGQARNLALRESAAPVVGFIDDDDRWLPDKTARQLRLLESRPERVAIVSGGAEFRHRRGRPTTQVPAPGPDLLVSLLEHPLFAPSATIVRRAAVAEAGGFPLYSDRTEDWSLWLALAKRGYEAAVLPDVVVTRADSAVSAEVMLEGFAAFHDRVRPDVEALPEPLRTQVLARQEFDRAVQVARAGRRREAAAALARAWRRHPRNPLPALHLMRTVTGERIWQLAADYSRGLRA
jgi:glycosyltransferase involved in cell wall biosynthesis